MTTVNAANVHAIALAGTFDDCQDMVKSLFNDLHLRDRFRFSAVNSINWARILPQVVYYFHAALALGAPHRRVAFAVPSGNFGNVYAGYVAAALGLPIAKLVVGTNANDILARFFRTGTMEVRAVQPTFSPSMDIQVSSNFERLLFDLQSRDGAATVRTMERFRQTGTFSVPDSMLAQARAMFASTTIDDAGTLRQIHSICASTGEILDPHSAIGVTAARAYRSDDGIDRAIPVVSLATAHPAKFADAVERSVGYRPDMPPSLASIMNRDERVTVLPNDMAAVVDHIAARTRWAEEAA